MIIESEKIAFIHVPKCGGTSVEAALLKMLGFQRENLPKTTKDKYCVFNNRTHHTLRMLEKDYDLRGWLIFAVIRDPRERALSELSYQADAHPRSQRSCWINNDIQESLITGHFWDCYPGHGLSATSMLRSDKGHEVVTVDINDMVDELPKLIHAHCGKMIDLEDRHMTSKKPKSSLGASGVEMIRSRWGDDFAAYNIPEPKVERRIWMFWDKGLEDSDLSRACYNSWRTLNPGWDVKFLDQNSELVTGIFSRYDFPPSMSIQHKADVLRIELLAKFGGVWVDTDIICMKPLDAWLCDFMGDDGVFQYRMDEGYDNAFMVMSKDSKLAGAWLQYCRGSWRDALRKYTWMHRKSNEFHRAGYYAGMRHVSSEGGESYKVFIKDIQRAARGMFLPRLLAYNPHMLALNNRAACPPGSKKRLIMDMFYEC